MNRFHLLIFALMMTVAAHAQFVNNGATVTIQSGATLRVETSFENQAGTITIDNGGILEVQGNFTNDGELVPQYLQPKSKIYRYRKFRCDT
ncbi:MAG: hypothetical protein IPJ13_04030 [Saprospiraceae bacterium]|nr:hypothetical protein [Saprospiraceae bacterium]